MVCLWNEGVPFFCATLLCEQFRRLKGGWTAFRVRVCHGWKGVVSPLLSDVHRLFQATDVLTLV